MTGERYLFTFRHRSRVVVFGPHENWQAAKEAFQFRYGYWPEVLICSEPYESGTA